MGRNSATLCGALKTASINLFIFFAMQNFANASEVILIADNGGEPIETVMKSIFGTGEDPSGKGEVTAIDNVNAISKMLQFPYKPSKATPGKHISKDFVNALQYAPPIVLIGSDNFSAKWLKKNSQRLRDLAATLVVIEASSEGDIKRLSSEFGGKIMPMTVSDELLKTYEIEHYPVLITQDGVYQ